MSGTDLSWKPGALPIVSCVLPARAWSKDQSGKPIITDPRASIPAIAFPAPWDDICVHLTMAWEPDREARIGIDVQDPDGIFSAGPETTVPVKFNVHGLVTGAIGVRSATFRSEGLHWFVVSLVEDGSRVEIARAPLFVEHRPDLAGATPSTPP